jgi:DNA-binding transcriptional LysR family regulator
MDRLEQLEIFTAILDAGSLAGAARKLGRSAPAVTRSLAALEQRIGTRLVERTTRRLAPTEAGRRVGEQARRVLAEYDAAVTEDAAAPPRGLLRITAPEVFGTRHVTPVIGSFLDKYPDMRVELVLNDHNIDLIDEGVDVAVRIGPMPDAGLVVRRVGEVRRMVVASRAYVRRCGEPESPQDVAAHDVIFNASRSAIAEWRFRQGGRESVVHLTPRFSVNSVEAALTAMKAGRGLARLLSYQVADDVGKGRVLRLLSAYEPPPLPVHLVMPSAKHMAPKLRAFVDHAAGALAQLDVLKPLKN